jgi:hypothetical protein
MKREAAPEPGESLVHDDWVSTVRSLRNMLVLLSNHLHLLLVAVHIKIVFLQKISFAFVVKLGFIRSNFEQECAENHLTGRKQF